MQRLLYMLDRLSDKAEDIQEVVDGTYVIPRRSKANPTDKDEVEYDPTYWLDDGCFLQITETNELKKDRPTVLLGIPAERLGIEFHKRNEVDNLKRLKNILLKMNPATEKFDDLYTGPYTVPALSEDNPSEFSRSGNSPIYWREGVSYEFEVTNKLMRDRPTLTVGIPAEDLGISADDYVVADYCLRQLKLYLDSLNDELYNRSRPVEENGWYFYCEPTGEVLIRNSAYFAERLPRDYDYGSGLNIYPWVGRDVPPKLYLCLMIQVQLPYHKMKKTVRMLTQDLPKALDAYIRNFDRSGLEKVAELSKTQRGIRQWLSESGYCAFIANGSVLPRSKGTDLPMTGAVPFKSPEGDEIEICGVRGMGIKRGVTVITGGGYSGKSTLIDAISAGIYDHSLGDGRELCITDRSAVTVSAEDGRCVRHVNISPFIKRIGSVDTADFSTDMASGSTSQAANIMEAIEGGSRLLLIDEDRSATNFMIRDAVMRELIENEPIIPFTERVRELSSMGVSTVLVIGGSAEYLSAADKIYMMNNYLPEDVTEDSVKICREKGLSLYECPEKADWSQSHVLMSRGFDSHPYGFGSERLSVLDLGIMMIGAEDIDLRGLHDIVSPRQLHGLGFILRTIMSENSAESIFGQGGEIDLDLKIADVYGRIAEKGLDCVYSSTFTGVERFFDLPRPEEVKAAVYRMRKTDVRQRGSVHSARIIRNI